MAEVQPTRQTLELCYVCPLSVRFSSSVDLLDLENQQKKSGDIELCSQSVE